MQVYIFDQDATARVPGYETWATENCIRFEWCSHDKDANKRFARCRPDVILTVNATEAAFPNLYKLPSYLRQRWVNIGSQSEVTVYLVRSIFENALKAELKPTISLFTPSYKSMERILRVYRSLLDQVGPDDQGRLVPFREWEWVIYSDSPPEDCTWADFLIPLADKDCRIKIHKTYCNDGNIGSVKRNAASLCRGEFLLEMDHDDELLPTALDDIIRAFRRDESVGLIGTDCIELYEHTLANHSYGDDYGFGFHSYYKLWHDNRWVNVARNGPLNGHTARYIIGVYNHARVWRRVCYEEVGRHDPSLNVADDYDLIIRTFIYAQDEKRWRLGLLPIFLYKQYRNEDGDNFTNHRNKYIQVLTFITARRFSDRIHDRLLELGVPDPEESQWHRPSDIAFEHWTHDPRADVVLDPTPDRISVVMPTFKRPKLMCRALKSLFRQTFKNWEVYVIGDCCPNLDNVMQNKGWLHDARVRWWNLSTNRKSGIYCRNYALKTLVPPGRLVTYLDDDNVIKPNHLASLHEAMTSKLSKDGRKPTFAFSSFIFEENGVEKLKVRCPRPILYRIDTSCLIHKMELLAKHNRYWRPEYLRDAEGNPIESVAGYAVDWDLVKVWVEANEPWVATLQYTLLYNNTKQNMEGIKNAYDDQNQDEDAVEQKVNLWHASPSVNPTMELMQELSGIVAMFEDKCQVTIHPVELASKNKDEPKKAQIMEDDTAAVLDIYQLLDMDPDTMTTSSHDEVESFLDQ